MNSDKVTPAVMIEDYCSKCPVRRDHTAHVGKMNVVLSDALANSLDWQTVRETLPRKYTSETIAEGGKTK